MPVMVVTRLRLRDPGRLDAFFQAAVAVLEQAKGSEGCVGTDVLAEAHDTWWTVSAWRDRTTMRAFVGVEPHLTTMAHLDEWCDEATFVDWEQPGEEIPDWPTCYARLIAEGKPATLEHASADNEAKAFPPPVVPPPD
jgi:quinol monooxygenase YgiN